MSLRKIAKYIAAFMLLSVVISLLGYPSCHALEPIEKAIDVSVAIGEARLTIFGYTSPHARVRLEGQGIFDEVHADIRGYFIFENRFAPASRRELCLTAYDDNGGSSQPTCLPPLPSKRHVVIGPIILPPIVKLNKIGFSVNDFAIIKGSTVPNTNVSIKLFSSDLNDKVTTGTSLPIINTTSNRDGSFSVAVPTTNGQRLRFFAQTEWNTIFSGKSTMLTINIMPLWVRFTEVIKQLLFLLSDYFITIVLLLEIGFLIWFLLARKKKKKAIQDKFSGVR